MAETPKQEGGFQSIQASPVSCVFGQLGPSSGLTFPICKVGLKRDISRAAWPRPNWTEGTGPPSWPAFGETQAGWGALA